MQFLLLAILASSSVSIAMRIGTEKVEHNYGMLTMNYVACTLLALIHNGFDNLPKFGPDLTMTIGLGAIAGIIYLVSFVLMQSNIEKNGVVLSSVFMKLGLLVPMLVSIVFFGEMPGMLQIIGFAIALIAIVLINVQKGSGGASSAISLVLLLLMGGGADLMSKIFEELCPISLSDTFLFFTFFFAFAISKDLVFFKHQRIGRKEVFYGFLVGIPNFYSSKFILRALEVLDGVIIYPSFSVGTLLVVTIAGIIFFHERLRKLQWIAVALIIVALVLLNI